MLSRTTRKFRDEIRRLPKEVQASAHRAYRLWLDDPWHDSLQFKEASETEKVYSARVGLHWRVLGFKQDNVIVWYWIGSHAEYDNLLKQL